MNETREKFVVAAKKVVPDILRTLSTIEIVFDDDMTKKAEHAITELKYRLAYDLSSIVSIKGNVNGYIGLYLNKSVILKITSYMANQTVTAIDDWVKDAAGEICNIVTGNIKAQLHPQGVHFDYGLPLVMCGASVSCSAKPPLLSTIRMFTTIYGNGCIEFAIDTPL